MMNPRRFLGAVLFTVGGIILFNVLLLRLGQGSIPRQLRRSIQGAPESQLTALGNSVIAVGFVPVEFSRGWASEGESLNAFNAGLGATGPVGHFMIGRQVLRHQTRSQRFVYGFYDFMLTDSTITPLSELFGNRATALIYEPELAARYLTANAFDRLVFQFAAKVPVFVQRESLWSKVERLRRQLGGMGLPKKASSRFGQAEDFRALEIANSAEFRRRCMTAVAQHRPLTPALADFFQEAADRGVRIYVVAVPMPGRHRDQTYDSDEWLRYLDYLQSLLARYQAVLISAGDWIADDEFVDPLHLGSVGAAEFSRRLGSELHELEKHSAQSKSEKLP